MSVAAPWQPWLTRSSATARTTAPFAPAIVVFVYLPSPPPPHTHAHTHALRSLRRTSSRVFSRSQHEDGLRVQNPRRRTDTHAPPFDHASTSAAVVWEPFASSLLIFRLLRARLPRSLSLPTSLFSLARLFPSLESEYLPRTIAPSSLAAAFVYLLLSTRASVWVMTNRRDGLTPLGGFETRHGKILSGREDSNGAVQGRTRDFFDDVFL